MPILNNIRHEMFAQGLAAGKTLEAAHKAAGFKPDRGNASRLQRRDIIVQRVAEIRGAKEAIVAKAEAKLVDNLVATRQWVIEQLTENCRRAMQAEPIRDSAGNPTGQYRYNGAVANRALELLGKELGMFIDRKEIREVDEFENMDTDTLRATVAEMLRGRGSGTRH